ncbi:dihydroorotate dehydrogenase (quinone), partial [bacterium]|nr:dihydroorotate dehydrogenase (quinone) [bacterium]
MLFDFIFRQLRPLIFSGDAETAHERMLTIVESISKIPGLIPFLRRQFLEEHSVLRTQLFGRSLQNPIGLAAGFDKDGRIHPALFALGFGFVEIGTVTPYPQSGNPRPRLFRLPEDETLINRLGFNNLGAQEMAELLVSAPKKIMPEDSDIIDRKSDFPANIAYGMLGINIGKNKDTILEKSTDDYVSCLNTLHPFADYFTLNISSPNTEDLRKLQEKDALRVLLDSVCAYRDNLDQNHIRE